MVLPLIPIRNTPGSSEHNVMWKEVKAMELIMDHFPLGILECSSLSFPDLYRWMTFKNSHHLKSKLIRLNKNVG